MIYRDFKDLKLSNLGLGAMRLPVIGGKDGNIDEKATQEMADYAIAHGINYYDTAWGYHDGNSEIAIGKALSRYPRESYFLATKFPGYDLSNMPKVKKFLKNSLKNAVWNISIFICSIMSVK